MSTNAEAGDPDISCMLLEDVERDIAINNDFSIAMADGLDGTIERRALTAKV
jgi:hypothetical protein